MKRKFFGTLYNTYSFFSLYANIDGFSYEQAAVPLADRQEIDRWIISLLNTLQGEVDADYAAYEPTLATRKVMTFVDDHLSNWYVRLCRRRFWKGEYTTDKIAAYQTLYECLVAISKMMAPVAPFFSDWLYQNLNDATSLEDHKSVHLADFPVADDSAIDKALEQRMDYAQRISSLVLSLRKKDRHRVRQPLQKILLPILDEGFQAQVEEVKDLILAEVNIKEIEYLTDSTGVIKKKAKANFKTLGRKLGKHMKAANGIIMAMDQDAIAQLEKTNSFKLEIEGTNYELTTEDVEVTTEDIPGWSVASDKDITVALDVTLTEELLAEGTAKELVNRIQNIRKSSGLEVTDRINVTIEETEEVTKALALYTDYIADEVLADSVSGEANFTGGEVVEFLGGSELRIGVEQV